MSRRATCLLFIFSKPMGRIELPSMIYETTALPLSYIGISEHL